MPFAKIKRGSAVAFILALLLSVSLVVSAQSGEIVILHTNDIHGHLTSFPAGESTMGGFDRLIGQVRALREEHPGRVLWLDGGDTWHGTNLANLTLGESVVDLLGAGGLDAMVLGNHDFNYGQSVLRQLAEDAAFPVLSANVVTEDGESLVAPTALFKAGEIAVGVLGLTTPDTPIATHPRNTLGLVFNDPIEVAREYVPRLQREADLVVVLSHLGHTQEVLLAETVPGIDVIVGGHSHTLLPSPVQVGDTLIVQANEWGKYLGVLQLTIDGGDVIAYEGRLIPITPELTQDEAILSLLGEWEGKMSELLDVVIGETLVHLDGERTNVRMRETNLGNLIADIVRDSASAEMALVNGGSIRTSAPPGLITLGTIYEILPFENTVYGLLLTGERLLAALENGVAYHAFGAGRFLQVSGLHYSFDPKAPAGQRVKEVRVRVSPDNPQGEPLVLHEVYRVAATDFISYGGDGFDMLVDAPRYYGASAQGGTYMSELFRDHLAMVGTVAPEIEGRITILGEP